MAETWNEWALQFFQNAVNGTLPPSGGSGATSQRVQGASASGVAPTGDPVLTGGLVGTAAPTVVNGVLSPLSLTTSAELRTQISNGGVAAGVIASNSDSLGTATMGLVTNSIGRAFDGSGNLARLRTIGGAEGTGLGIQSVTAPKFYFTDTTTNLGIAGTFTGTSRAAGGASGFAVGSATQFGTYAAEVFANQAGTLFVEKSTDAGVTWTPCNGTAGTAVALNTTVMVSTSVFAGLYRTRYTNGGVAQTVFNLTSRFGA